MRTGIGFDAHAFDSARPLVLGGVTIPGAPGLAGWSDADVLSHAVADALLGAAALGDLGAHFSESQVPEGISSLEILTRTSELLADAGYSIGNIDATVIAQSVVIAPHCSALRSTMAAALGIDGGRVNVKATTTDKLGFTGRGEGIAAIAVAGIDSLRTRNALS